MRYLHGTKTICLEYGELVPDFLTESNYKYHKSAGNFVTHGRGGNGNGVLIEFDSLPDNLQEKVRAKYGADLHKHIAKLPLAKMVVTDYKAANFYASHVKNGGGHLPLELQQRYQRQAEWLNMIQMLLDDKRALKDTLNISIDTFWEYVIDLHQVDRPVNPVLPKTKDKLRKLLVRYKENGYASLISKKFGNQNTRKVSPKIENLMLSLWDMVHNPTPAEVCRLYKQFINGTVKVVDTHPETGGEMLNPQDFFVKGEPYALAQSTVAYYLNKPAAQVAVNARRLKKLEFVTGYRPYVQRLAPQFAFSKITMDDRDLPFKDMVGERSVKTYQIMDVASQCIIGKAFSRDKNVELIREAFRDMYQLIICNGWGFPAEVEMERHLTSQMMGREIDGDFEDDILTAGNLFKFTRVCMGGNAPEKRAEHIFRHKKYTFDNKRPGFQGRFYARNVAYRLNADKENNVRYLYEQIVQNDLDDINSWNNSLHSDQTKYPGMTRWEVLENCQNPNLIHHPASSVMPYIGYKSRETSLRRGYIQVQGSSYRLPNINILRELPNWNFDAYYIPGPDGIEKVYLYQGKKFITEAPKVIPFQEAQAEMTDADRREAQKQWAYQQAFDAMYKELRGKIMKVGTAVFDGFEAADSLKVAEMVPVIAPQYDGFEPKRAGKKGGYKQKTTSYLPTDTDIDNVENRAKWAL